MKSLKVVIDFITGRCVAASVSDRDHPEWPPHPGRLFMAMAATVFETGESDDEVSALQWLESLPAPEIHSSEANFRSLVKHYVPVNDKISVNKSILQSIPGLTRSKQERSYPTSIPIDTKVIYLWNNTEGIEMHIKALNAICSNLIRVGHSSSLVRAWTELNDQDEPLANPQRRIWKPVSKQSDLQVRIPGNGEFERLKSAYNADKADQFVDIVQTIESLKGKPQREAKKLFEEQFGIPYGKNLRAPEPTPARLGLWQGYRLLREETADQPVVACSHFDSELLILTKMEGRNLSAQDTLALTARLRDAAMSNCSVIPTPAWLGGHDPESGKPTNLPHVAFLSLPFVGREYADAHVMGLALAVPRTQYVSAAERGRLLGPLFYNQSGDVRDVVLKLGPLGEWTLRLEERSEPPLSLQNRTWVGPSKTWASVTPVVLDRYPKSSMVDNRKYWESEVRETISRSCTNAGLPHPVEIDLDTTGWHVGTPRAYPKSRTLRSTVSDDLIGKLGDGYPQIPGRPTKPSRPQIHVFLRFEQPILGPVLIGGGRFCGYGLCKPITMKRPTK